MSSPLAAAIVNLSSAEAATRFAGAQEIYLQGRVMADSATQVWRDDAAFSALLGAQPVVTVGLAVEPGTFERIHVANGVPDLATVPPDQDAREFELHFSDGVALDVLTTRDPRGDGAIARYLAKFGEGIQQVEYRCADVERASAIVKEKFGVAPIYPQARVGADDTWINFFLAPIPGQGKVLIELYQLPDSRR
jgi:hypothetical protein